LSRAEFAYLYYPSAPQGLPPYDLNAHLVWFTLSVQSAQGMHRALDERGGQALHIAGLRCAEKPDSQGENVVWAPVRCAGCAPQPTRSTSGYSGRSSKGAAGTSS
jgi:hypothetical protein